MTNDSFDEIQGSFKIILYLDKADTLMILPNRTKQTSSHENPFDKYISAYYALH